ncbi:hypothetical protein MKW94_012090 [Papaver nudicaule]|uniref:Auxin-responsive protein n=1 Tax=Papaver nudicaule TaxID=74823 RepID=A0AA42AXM5_PAPNU|nr:hypothetical protein [Papaver nudicaule]
MAEKEGLGFEITELRLGLPGVSLKPSQVLLNKKRSFSEIVNDENSSTTTDYCEDRDRESKTQIVGWPPVCSHRKKSSISTNVVIVQEEKCNDSDSAKLYVKISMDGAPFLRKLDLNVYEGYSDLMVAFEKLFSGFIPGEVLNDTDNSEYVPIYEDKEGDWMLVGDVPWTMFTESCKRLRIMKRSNAKQFGLRGERYEGTNNGIDSSN